MKYINTQLVVDYMENNNLTFVKLSKNIGISTKTLKKIINDEGNLKVETIFKLANIMGVPVSDLLGENLKK